jgi:nicotinate-nucleotide adenylyltransferase
LKDVARRVSDGQTEPTQALSASTAQALYFALLRQKHSMLHMRPSPHASFLRTTAHLPHAAPGQVIGLLGGSFNPPHAAHRLISEIALRRVGLAKIWWVVSPGNPLKTRADTAPLAQRLVQCREIARNPHIVVTDFEADLQSPYTASTLAYLKARTPLVRYLWIMGADNLAQFARWQRWREIFTMVPIVVVDRPGWRLKALASKAARAFASSRVPETDARSLAHRPPPAWTFLTGPLSAVSSTALRSRGKGQGTSGRQNRPTSGRASPPSDAPGCLAVLLKGTLRSRGRQHAPRPARPRPGSQRP